MRLILVEWEDISSTYDPAWTAKGEITDLECVPCVTCGIALHESDEDIHVILSSNVDCFSQAIVIPKSCIKRIRKLGVLSNG